MNPHSETSPELTGVRRWRVPDDAGLAWRRWDRAAVVFHPLSGETHYLNIISMVALELLEGDAYSADDLAEAVARYLDIPNDENMLGQAAALIDQFDGLGLIEPCRE